MSIIKGPGVGSVPDNAARVDNSPADLAPVVVQALPGQTGPALQVQNSSGAVVWQVDAAGNASGASVSGLNVPTNPGLRSVVFASDANKTLDGTLLQGMILVCTSTPNLTATRDVIVPVTSGAWYLVFNNTSGAQAIQVIGASGTGITIAAGKTALVYCDGTNWLRATADV